jgi:hypothetical protein
MVAQRVSLDRGRRHDATASVQRNRRNALQTAPIIVRTRGELVITLLARRHTAQHCCFQRTHALARASLLCTALLHIGRCTD